jgi:galactose mutarotase-like enzyme
VEHDVDEVQVEGHRGIVLACRDTHLRAVVHPELAMLTSSLTHRGAELLGQRNGIAAYADHGSTMGIPLLHPWANRLGATRYSLGGIDVALDLGSDLLHFDDNGLPMHGLRLAGAGWLTGDPVARESGASVSATLDFGATPKLLAAFPFPHRITVSTTISAAALETRVAIEATGDLGVPLALGFHPYFAPPGVERAAWELETPVLRRADLDERGIPTGVDHAVAPVRGPLAEQTFDDLYTDLADPPIFSVSGGGRRIALEFREGYHVAQIYAPSHDAVIAFEPMTAPTNALQSGWMLRTVPPGGRVHTSFAVTIDG